MAQCSAPGAAKRASEADARRSLAAQGADDLTPDAAVQPFKVQQPGPPRDAVEQNEQRHELAHSEDSEDPSQTFHVFKAQVYPHEDCS